MRSYFWHSRPVMLQVVLEMTSAALKLSSTTSTNLLEPPLTDYCSLWTKHHKKPKMRITQENNDRNTITHIPLSVHTYVLHMRKEDCVTDTYTVIYVQVG